MYDLARVIALRRQIREQLVERFDGKTPVFDDLVAVFKVNLPEKVPEAALYDSLLYLAGRPLDKVMLDEAAWRVAGNVPRLVRHKAVPPWNRQSFAEWVPVQIMSARRGRSGKGLPGHTFTFKIMAGSSCPLMLTKFWPDRFARFMAFHLGFSRYRPSDRSLKPATFQFRHPRELVTLRLSILVEPKLCGREPGFEQTKAPSGLLDWNREQLRHRDRLEAAYPCPKGFSREVACCNCWVGYKNCRAACHQSDFVFKACSACKREDAPFDIDVSTELCVDCCDRQAMAAGK